MNPGTQLLALGDGYVTCGTLSDQDNFCGQTSESGGYGIGIYYYDCDCIVYYSHATDVLPQFTNGENTPVKAGQVVGLSGASRFVKADGTIGTYAHLHLEVRNVANTIVYNPIYFFTPSAWSSMNLTYMPYHNNYANPQTRMYAIQMQDGYNYWHGPYPLVWVR